MQLKEKDDVISSLEKERESSAGELIAEFLDQMVRH